MSTASPGTTVAVFGNVAYEGTTGGIAIVDISNPASPKLMSTLNNSLIFTGTFALNFVKIVGNDLYVASDFAFQSPGVNLLVYSLTDPAKPTLVGSTSIPYPDLGDLLVNSNATDAFIPDWSFLFENFDRHIIDQFGTFLSVDLSTPAAPQLSNVLFNDNGPATNGQ